MQSVVATRTLALLAIAAWLTVASDAQNIVCADDFRILSRVYVGDNKEPASQTTTIFRAGLVYDCIDQPAEVVLFDPPGGRFVLLEPERKLRGEITLPQIEALLPTLKQKVAKREGALAAFLIAPEFEQQDDPQTGETEFRSPFLSYRVKAMPAQNDTVAAQYALFSAQYTRLNTLKHPMLLARGVVNDWLNKRRLIPEEVRLTTFKKKPLGRVTPDSQFRSQHIVTYALSSEDLRRVEEIERWLVEFRPVRLTEYWEKKEPPEKE